MPPDLPTPELRGEVGIMPQSAPSGRSNGHASAAATTAIATSRPQRRSSIPLPKPILDADASATLRDQLLGEISALGSSEQIDEWAPRGLAAKNTLQAGDALLIEDAFRQKIAELQPLPDRPSEAPAPQVSSPSEVTPHATATAADPDRPATDLPDFEHYAVTPKPRRLRDKLHREFVAAQPCVVCGRQPSDAHHLRFTQPTALGRKVSDEFTVPLCRMHHREIHRTVKEQHWWSRVGIDPIPIADKLWAQTHPGAPKSPAQIQADTFSVQSTAAP